MKLLNAAEMERRGDVSELAAAIVDHLVRLKGLIDTLPPGALRDALDHGLVDLLIPATEAVVTGDADAT